MTQQHKTRAIVLDINVELERYILQIQVFTPHLQYTTIQEIFITALRCLHFSYNTREAVESLMLEIHTTFCPNIDSTEQLLVLEFATKRFVDELHQQLVLVRAYDQDDELHYTLGGWLHPFSPYLIRTSDIKQFSESIPLVVQSQYEIPREYPDNAHYWNPGLYLQQSKLPFE